MEALCFADVHGDTRSAVKLRNAAASLNLDYVFMLGDYSRGFRDPAENKADILMILDIFKDIQVKAIPGNCDQPSSVDIFREKGVNLHETVLRLPGVNIIGLGGSNPTPFNTPFEHSEEEITDKLDRLHSKTDPASKTIVMTHSPPYGTGCDVIAGGVHVGSRALREYVESKKPSLLMCSHIHEAGGVQDKIGDTSVINLGRLSDGRAYLLHIEDTITVELYIG